jgi:hypothetical protein
MKPRISQSVVSLLLIAVLTTALPGCGIMLELFGNGEGYNYKPGNDLGGGEDPSPVMSYYEPSYDRPCPGTENVPSFWRLIEIRPNGPITLIDGCTFETQSLSSTDIDMAEDNESLVYDTATFYYEP